MKGFKFWFILLFKNFEKDNTINQDVFFINMLNEVVIEYKEEKMANKKGLKKIKFPETVDAKFLEKTKKAILKDADKIDEYEFVFKEVLEFDTSLFQFLIATKKYISENGMKITFKEIPHEGQKLFELYEYKI